MTNLYLISENENIKVPNNDTCKLSNLNFKGASHLNDNIFNDEPKKCFQNAINKNAFSETRIIDGGYDYIMYMCSNTKYDFFKSKITKTKWKVLR